MPAKPGTARFSVQGEESGDGGAHPDLSPSPGAGASSAVLSAGRWAQPAPSVLADELWMRDTAEPPDSRMHPKTCVRRESDPR